MNRRYPTNRQSVAAGRHDGVGVESRPIVGDKKHLGSSNDADKNVLDDFGFLTVLK